MRRSLLPTKRLGPRRTGLVALAAGGLATLMLAAPGPAGAATGTPGFTVYAAPSSFPNADNAGEPSIGIGPSGRVLYQAYTSTYRFTPSTATWANVTPVTSQYNLDPILTTDSVSGRTFAGGLDGECSILSYSDNDGASWTPAGNACAGVIDHETIGAGAYHAPAPLGALSARAVYYCAQTIGDACATSTNGGAVFGPPVLVTGACSSLHGHVKVAPDGTAYLPNAHCGGLVGGAITTNNGSSWSSYTIPGSSQASEGFDPSVGIGSDSTAYEAWSGSSAPNDFTPYVSVRAPGGAWSSPKDVSNGLVKSSTFQAAVAGDGNRAAVAYLGSATGGNPFVSGWPGVWDLYVSYTFDRGATWSTVKASTHPVQRGWLCASGTTCNTGRNLLDFMDASVTPTGNVVVGYADGCLSCTTEAQSTHAYATLAVQTSGQSLFAAQDTAPAVPVP